MKSGRYVMFCLLFSIQICGISLADMFANSESIASDTAAQESESSAAALQQQKFISSEGYESVISTMSSSGVMNDFADLVATLQSGVDVDQTKMDNVVANLTTLLKGMLSAYNEASMPVMATTGNGAYNYFSTIVLLYTVRLRYLSNLLFISAQSGTDYANELTALLDAFSSYKSSLLNLTGEFPSTSSNSQMADYYRTLPDLAMNDYYAQSANIILTKILSVVDFAKNVTAGEYDQATWAIDMYNKLMGFSTLQVGTSMYDSFAEYQSALLTSLYSVCQNALNSLSSSIDFIANPITSNLEMNPNQIIFQEQEELYSSAISIFSAVASFSSQNVQLSAGLADVTKKYNATEEAAELISQVQLDCTQVSADILATEDAASLNGLLGTIQAAVANCTTVQSDVTLIGDAVSLEAVQTLQNYLNAMYWLTYMKYYWAVYLEDAQSGGQALSGLVSSLDTMNDSDFMGNFTTLINSMGSLACIQSLDCAGDIEGICQSPSANLSAMFASKYDLSKFISYAITLMSSDELSSDSVPAPTCCDVSVLKVVDEAVSQVKDLGEIFYKIDTTLQNISAEQLSKLKLLLAEILICAKKIDDLYSANGDLANYLPNLAVSVMPLGAQTFVDMSMEIVVYVLGNLAEGLSEKGKYLEASVCYALLQGHKSYLSDDDEAYILSKLNGLGDNIELSVEAATIVNNAKSGTWSSVDGWMQNQSWLSGILLYQLAYEIASQTDGISSSLSVPVQVKTPDSILTEYDQAIQDYIVSYESQVAESDRQPLDLLYLYYLLMMNYSGTGNASLSDVASDMGDLFQNDDKTGFFDLLEVNLSNFTAETDTSVLSDKKKNLTDLMDLFQTQMYSEESWLDQYELLFGKTMSPMLSINDGADGSKVYSFNFDDVLVSTVIPDLDAAFASIVKTVGDNFFATAKTASSEGDFLTAYQNYSSAMTQYKMIMDQTSSGDTVSAQYLLTKTLSEASLMASLVLRGDIQSVGDVPDIAVTNLLSTYSFTLPTVITSFFSDADLALADDGKTLSWSVDQIQNVLKLVALNSELTNSGYNYGQLFSPGTTNLVSGLDSSDTAAAQSFLDTAESYFSIISAAMSSGNMIDGESKVMAVSAEIDDSSNVTITCLNMPIAPLVSYYSDHPNAAQYYSAALMLFKPGSDNVQVGNVTYVPGNDETASQKMRLFIAATALATTKLYVDEIAISMGEITNELSESITTDEQSSIVLEFNNEVKDKYNKIIAILLDPTTGAILYYNDNNASDYASSTQKYAMSLYESYQTNISALLVGDPTSTVYSGILYDLNLAYQTEETYTTDSDLLTALKGKVADLFKNAADACMTYFTVDDAGITKHYYDKAAVYYNAASAQYKLNGDISGSDAAKLLEYQAYAKDGFQDIAVYCYSKTNGISYSDAGGSVHSITLDQLISDYQAFSTQFSLSADQSMSPNEITLYNNIESLFLNGAMVLSAAAAGPDLSTDDSSSVSDTPVASSSNSLDPAVISFLQNNNIQLAQSLETVANPDYVEPEEDAGADAISDALDAVSDWNSSDSQASGSNEEDANPKTLDVTVYNLPESYDTYQQIFELDSTKTTSLAIQAVEKFIADQNKNALSSWLSTMFNAAAYLYISDYLGAGDGSVSDVAQDQEEFYERLQAQGIANQNPASMYMG